MTHVGFVEFCVVTAILGVDNLKAAIEYLIANATPTEFSWQRIPNPPRKPNNSLPRTKEWNENISKSKIGSTPWNKGKPWSDEAKSKISKSAKNRKVKDL